jgi:CRP-like cAMP-binding protein
MTWMSHLDWGHVFEWTGAALAILGAAMKTIIPLRIVGIAGNLMGLATGLFLGRWASVLVNCILLPMNSLRMFQMLKLIRKVKKAASSDLSMEWLKPFMTRRAVKAGETLFAKGDRADCMFYTLTGEFRLRQLGLEVMPGRVVGEMGFLSPDNKRTQTLECVMDGEVLSISYDELRQLYFQNPEFGFYFLKLVSERMFNNMARLEEQLTLMQASAEDRLSKGQMEGQAAPQTGQPISA